MSSVREWLRDNDREWVKSASSWLTYQMVQFIGVIVRRLTRRQTRRLASLLGDFLHDIVKLRRELVYTNLGLSFPEKSPQEIRDIAIKVYRNVAVALLDVLRLPLIRDKEDAAALVDIENPEVFWQGTDNGRKGAVLVSAHYGNWELLAFASGLLVKPMTIIVKELSNILVDRAINRLRTMRGNSIVYDDQAVREGLRLLGEGGVLAILADQSDPSATNFGEFLGRRATVFHGAAFFALRAKVPLFVGMCRHGNDGKYKVEVTEVDTSDLKFCKEDIATLALRYTRVLEEYIRRWPEEWFWLHNRWKNG
ncbi:MAG: lysophospholipid acyltransferase family protein [Chlorobiaceae bacterium]|nr:lysophospholipid acyltransferase family protein [Chlorobiaceae bacterium]